MSDLELSIAAALEVQASLKPRKGEADALLTLDDLLDALALDREFSLATDERQRVIRDWAQGQCQRGAVAGSWVGAAESRELAKGGGPSYLYRPEVRRALASGRYVSTDMTLDDIGDNQALIGSGGRAWERACCSPGWGWGDHRADLLDSSQSRSDRIPA